MAFLFSTNQQPPQRGGAVHDPIWVGSKWLLAFLRIPVTQGTPLAQTIFSPCCPLNDRKRAARSLFEIGRMSSLFSCLSLSRLRLLIFPLLMSNNVCLNPGSVFPSSVCAENVTWRSRSEQYCSWSKWVHLKCSLLSFSKFRTLDNSHSWSCPPAASLFLLETSHLPTLWLPFGLFQLIHLHCSIWPSANAALPRHPRLHISYPFFVHFASSPYAPSLPRHAPGCLSTPPASSFPVNLSGFFNGMLEVFEPGALNFYTFFCLIPLTAFVFMNLTLIHLPLSGSLNSLLCYLIAATPGMAFSLLIPRTL